MSRTLRGVWARRWTLLPLVLLTVVVVGGTVTVLVFASAAGTSRLLAIPLLLLGLVAVPGTARELVLSRRGELALARLRGVRGVALLALTLAEPAVVLVLGGLVGLVVGWAGGQLAAARWAAGAGSFGWLPVLAAAAIVGVALVTIALGSAATLREPLGQQLGTALRPRAASLLATFGTVLVVVAAVVAVYRSRVSTGAPDWVVLAGPALVGLACGEAVVWLLRLGARVLVPLTAGRGLGGFLAARRVARVADAVTSVRVLVAAAAVAGLAFTGAQQVDAWTDATARLTAGAPLRIGLDTDANGALELTHRLDPDGRYLMAAVLVPGTGSVPARRVFLDTARYRRVIGDFYDGTAAGSVGARVGSLGGRDQGLGVGSRVSASVRGVSRRDGGLLRPRITVGYRDDTGQSRTLDLRTSIDTDGTAQPLLMSLDGCTRGCVVTSLALSRTRGDVRLPWLLTGLRIGDLDVLAESLGADPSTTTGAGSTGPVVTDEGLVALPSSGTQRIEVASASDAGVPVLATTTARWTDGPPELESPGGDERTATVLQRYDALPLVQHDGVLADLPRATAGAPPTVPAAEVMVLARADTPARVLTGLRSDQQGPVRTLAEVRDTTFRQTRSAQADVYAVMAVCCLLVALLVLGTAAARQRRDWLRDLAALRVVGVDRSRLRGAGVREVAALGSAAVVGTAAATVLSVRLLLGHLPLVDVPTYAVPLRTGLATVPLVVTVVVVALVVALVAGRGRRTSPAASRPALLRDEVR